MCQHPSDVVTARYQLPRFSLGRAFMSSFPNSHTSSSISIICGYTSSITLWNIVPVVTLIPRFATKKLVVTSKTNSGCKRSNTQSIRNYIASVFSVWHAGTCIVHFRSTTCTGNGHTSWTATPYKRVTGWHKMTWLKKYHYEMFGHIYKKWYLITSAVGCCTFADVVDCVQQWL